MTFYADWVLEIVPFVFLTLLLCIMHLHFYALRTRKIKYIKEVSAYFAD